MTSTIRIQPHQRGLRSRYGVFKALLGPGTYRLWRRMLNADADQVEIVSTVKPRFDHPIVQALSAYPTLREAFQVVDLAQSQRALVWVDGRLDAILGPGRYAYWREPHTSAKIEVEAFETGEPRFTHPRLEAILAHPGASVFFEVIEAERHTAALLFRSGVLVETLRPGKHAFWKGTGSLRATVVDLREKTLDVAGQEIMTADKVTLRVNLVVTFQVVDALASVSIVADADQTLYREAQLALRGSIGGRTLDALLADKHAIGAELLPPLQARASQFGVAVRSIGVKDIVLPGEMKTILNQVIEAEKRAQADLIKRREETASARSQANTARLLADNPMLARVRELEMLKDVFAGTRATFVLGPSDLAGQIRSLTASSGE